MEKKFNYKNSKGLSAIVTTVILIALSIAAVVVVWSFVNNFINKEVESSGSCFGNFDKVYLNKLYTCYEPVGGNYNLRFSIGIGDIEVEKVIVSIYSESSVKSYTLTNVNQTLPGLTLYPSGLTNVILPKKNSGLSYKVEGFTDKIDSIEIAPVIGGNQCDVSDSYSEIDNCAVYVR